MKVESKPHLILTLAEQTTLINCHNLLCDMVRDNMINHTVNNDMLPCGFSVEDLRDGIGFIIDNAVIE